MGGVALGVQFAPTGRGGIVSLKTAVGSVRYDLRRPQIQSGVDSFSLLLARAVAKQRKASHRRVLSLVLGSA